MPYFVKVLCWFLLYFGTLSFLYYFLWRRYIRRRYILRRIQTAKKCTVTKSNTSIPIAKGRLVIPLILGIISLSVVLTIFLFLLFPAVVNLPNVVTVFVGVFGFIAGTIAMYEYFNRKPDSF